jgi:hypothetical protein
MHTHTHTLRSAYSMINGSRNTQSILASGSDVRSNRQVLEAVRAVDPRLASRMGDLRATDSGIVFDLDVKDAQSLLELANGASGAAAGVPANRRAAVQSALAGITLSTPARIAGGLAVKNSGQSSGSYGSSSPFGGSRGGGGGGGGRRDSFRGDRSSSSSSSKYLLLLTVTMHTH